MTLPLAGSLNPVKSGGVGYATSNPKIDAYKAKIEDFKQKIISGQITVPEKP